MIAATVWWLFPGLCRWLPRPFAAGLGAIFGACLYAALTGFAVPTLRTASDDRRAGRGALLCGGGNGSPTRTRPGLHRPLLLLDPLAVLGAGFLAEFRRRGLVAVVPARRPGPRRWAMLHGFVAAQAVATLGLLPLTVLLFGQASFAGPIANLAAVPWWSLVVVPGTAGRAGGDRARRPRSMALAGQQPGVSTCCGRRWRGSPTARWRWPGCRSPRWHAWPLAMLSAFWLLLPRGLPGKPLALLLWLPLLCPPRDLPVAWRGQN